MIELVRKRHDGDGWIVFQELGDKPGVLADRSADAVALGVWRSKKYEAHLYEFKISREDVKRELRDPRKAEGVGKYCHYWWLVVDDEKRLTDLVVPEVWGILKLHITNVGGKEQRRLAVVRKAPRLTPEPFSPMFVVSAIRNIRRAYVDPIDHKRVADELAELKYGKNRTLSDEERDEKEKLRLAEQKLRYIEGYVERFEERSGVKLDTPSWEWGRIGDAVKIVLKLAENEHADGNVLKAVAALSTASEELERKAKELAQSAVQLRELHRMNNGNACAPSCASQRKYHPGRCSCGQHALSMIEKQLQVENVAIESVQGRCDNCDPSFGCWNSPRHCSKKPLPGICIVHGVPRTLCPIGCLAPRIPLESQTATGESA